MDIPGNSSSWALLGSFVIWFSWYSINLGRVYTLASSDGSSGLCAVNTTLSGVSGGLISLYLARWAFSVEEYVVWDVISTGNGIVAGLVSISASCAVVYPWAALLIGAIGGAIYFASSQIIPGIMKVCCLTLMHFFNMGQIYASTHNMSQLLQVPRNGKISISDCKEWGSNIKKSIS